ncbi:centromere protein T isoform X2 [Spea bombifrons]|nr:centromere protein T isoform X2 [Spea bombifrons]XP_053305534.1 centromere protein T isoform X2 [Spea bombifrons]XP_053305535.1 centromere protein T isoform X2 [Spea bombifrons]
MDDPFEDNLTTRSLLKGILASEAARSAVKHHPEPRVLRSGRGLSPGASPYRIKNNDLSTPSMNLRSKMKARVRDSVGTMVSSGSTRKRNSQSSAKIKQNNKKRRHSNVEDFDNVTPRTLLRKIIQNEPEVSMIVSQRTDNIVSENMEHDAPSQTSTSSISKIDMSLPEPHGDDYTTVFGNARKKKRVSVTQFEKAVEERLPPSQEKSKVEESIGDLSALVQLSGIPRSLRTNKGTPNTTGPIQKGGLVRRPKKFHLVSLEDFEQGVENNYQQLKGSQDCFVESTEEESDTSSNDMARNNTELYAHPVQNNKSISRLHPLEEVPMESEDGEKEEDNAVGVSKVGVSQLQVSFVPEHKEHQKIATDHRGITRDVESHTIGDQLSSHELRETYSNVADNTAQPACTASPPQMSNNDLGEGADMSDAPDLQTPVLKRGNRSSLNDILKSQRSSSTSKGQGVHYEPTKNLSLEKHPLTSVVDSVSSEPFTPTSTPKGEKPLRYSAKLQKVNVLTVNETLHEATNNLVAPDHSDGNELIQQEQSGEQSFNDASSVSLTPKGKSPLRHSAKLTKLNVQPGKDAGRENTEELEDPDHSDGEELISQDSNGEESLNDEKSVAYDPKKSNKPAKLSPLPNTPDFIRNARMKVIKKPPADKPIQKKKTTRNTAKEHVLPNSFIKQMFSHYAKLRVSKESYKEVAKCMEIYFGQLSNDLAAYTAHANRKTITRADIELLMRRHGLVTDTIPLNVLIEKHLPLEYRKLLIPCATSGNKVFPTL